ncbi:MAG: hypothetical protein ACRENL_00075 [Candidatus Dormibacteria bacterium]
MILKGTFRSAGRGLAALLWFRIDGGWIYYVVLAAYGVLVASAVYLLSRPGWLTVLGALIILIDGMTVTLFLLHRWLTKRLGRTHPSR